MDQIFPREGTRMLGCSALAIRRSGGDHMPSKLVGVAGFEPAASSSRSQVAVPTASGAACLTWERPSVSVRWCPLLAVVIVTHLVTRSLLSGCRARLLRRSSGADLRLHMAARCADHENTTLVYEHQTYDP